MKLLKLLATLACSLPFASCGYSVYTVSICTTLVSRTPVGSIRTVHQSTSITQTVTAFSVKTPTSTIYPPNKTITASSTTVNTVTTTLANTIAPTTFTSTTTIISAVPYTPTVSATSTSTTTITTTQETVSTVLPSPGFTPIDANPGTSKRTAVPDPIPRYMKRQIVLPSYYPSAVVCATVFDTVFTKTSIVTARSTSTTTAPALTDTQVVAIHQTVTSTVLSPVQATSTYVATTTMLITSTYPAVTSSSTTTSTATFTVLVPTATTYAVCAPNNDATMINGGGIDSLTNTPANIKEIMESDPYTCCTYCATDPKCGGAAVAVGFLGAICTLYYPDTCDARVSIGNYASTGATLIQFTGVFNGNCGQFTPG